MSQQNFDINTLLMKAINELQYLESGDVFLVKNLFKGYCWDKIPKKDRLLLGILFLNEIHKGDFSVEIIEKNSSGQQQYRKE